MDREPRFHGEVSEERHRIMSKIRGKDTKPEIVLRKYLWSKGLRYRKNCKGLPGKPEIALTKYKVAVCCDSEFFHGKDWNKQRVKVKNGSNSD
jgi:DNA mismatch endonuclease (patch repair protein)